MSSFFQCSSLGHAAYPAISALSSGAEIERALQTPAALAATCLETAGEHDFAQYQSAVAVDDLDSVRRSLGAETITIYGTSYGAELAQLYASRYPEHVEALVLDSPIDPDVGGMQRRAETSAAASEVLLAALTECDADPICAHEFGDRPAVMAYDELRASLSEGGRYVTLTAPNGSPVSDLLVTVGDLEFGMSSYLGSPGERVVALRALAAASKGDLRGILRLSLAARGMAADGTVAPSMWSAAAYFATECADHPLPAEPTINLVDHYLAQAEPLRVRASRLTSPFYRDLTCAYWRPGESARETAPDQPAAWPPALVLAATLDPVVPFSRVEQIVLKLGAQSVVVDGVAHGLLDGDGCVGSAVGNFLLTESPEGRKDHRRCGVEVDAVRYSPNARASVDDYADLLAAAEAIEFELRATPELIAWSGSGSLHVGCAEGGSASLTYEGPALQYELDACSVIADLALTGRASATADQFEMSVRFLGGGFTYEHSRGGAVLTGTRHGERLEVVR